MAPIPFKPPSSGGTTGAPAPVSDVATRHRQYVEYMLQWSRLADVMAGQDAVRRNARLYIPASQEQIQTPELYHAMIGRTPYTNYVARCVDGILGLIFRKEPSVTVPSRFKPRLDNINNAGENLLSFAKKLVYQVVVYGRVGISVEVLPEDQQSGSDTVSLLPYLTLCVPQSITNWRPKVINGQTVPDQIIIQEEYEQSARFGSVPRTRYRVLELDESDDFRVQLWESSTSTGEFYMASQEYPRSGRNDGDRYLHRIPFVFVGPGDLGMNVHKSPILDIADANLTHFLLQSYLHEALYFAAQPTPVITGWQEGQPANFRFGGGNLWLLPENCTASILEFRGHGLEPQARAVADQQEQIAELGTRLFQSATSGPETAEAARIRSNGQTSVVSSIARTVSDGIKAAIEIACAWDRTEGKVEVELNQDYTESMLDPQMLQQMIALRREDLITDRDVAAMLIQNELVEPGKSIDQVADDMKNQTPRLLGMPTAPNGQTGQAEKPLPGGVSQDGVLKQKNGRGVPQAGR